MRWNLLPLCTLPLCTITKSLYDKSSDSHWEACLCWQHSDSLNCWGTGAACKLIEMHWKHWYFHPPFMCKIKFVLRIVCTICNRNIIEDYCLSMLMIYFSVLAFMSGLKASLENFIKPLKSDVMWLKYDKSDKFVHSTSNLHENKNIFTEICSKL